ncbi:MAG: reverse transcriptase family protein, partial [Bacteroidales bacterium]
MSKKDEEAKRLEELRRRVYEYREKKMRETTMANVAMKSYNYKGFPHSKNMICYVCMQRGHRTNDCEFTFMRVVKRLEEIDKEKSKTIDSRTNVQIEARSCRKPYKRTKMETSDATKILDEFNNVFYKDDEPIKFCRIEKCAIKTKRGEKIVKKGVMVPQALRKDLKEHLQNLERRCIIRRSASEWRNPIRAIQKPKGGLRLVSNFIALNDLCEKDPYELKNIREVINETQGYNYFTLLDLKDAFYSIEIEERDKHKTAFEFNGIVYEWNSMVMGYKNAPQILQRVMTKILDDELKNGVSIYMDDVIICGRTRGEHDKLLRRVLERLEINNLKVNKQKIQLALGEVELLGVKINGLEQAPNEIKQNE